MFRGFIAVLWYTRTIASPFFKGRDDWLEELFLFRYRVVLERQKKKDLDCFVYLYCARCDMVRAADHECISGKSRASYDAWCGDSLHAHDVRVRIGFVNSGLFQDLTRGSAQKAYYVRCTGDNGITERAGSTKFEECYWTDGEFRQEYLGYLEEVIARSRG